MSIGWICPKCGRALAPWMSECPCYQGGAAITSNSTTIRGNLPTGRCSKVCDNKTDLGYCRTTACIKPEYGGDEDYGRGTYA
jgi:hypothetical protein